MLVSSAAIGLLLHSQHSILNHSHTKMSCAGCFKLQSILIGLT